jgi:hydroxyethylthiazole kinase-like uncharacterized protein yjeF
MMENAGLQLANLIASCAKDLNAKILIGVGNGNNGGGGLVAARRLVAWRYSVCLDVFSEINKELPKRQLERALKFGAKKEVVSPPDIWVDAYLGFSQRLPLCPNLLDTIHQANQGEWHRISLDIPTGFLGDTATVYFHADKVLSLAASKKILYHLPKSTEVFVADLGIPKGFIKKSELKFNHFI